MNDKEQNYNNKTVLQFILNAINKGKKHDKTRGVDLIKSGLWDALVMFRPDVKNPLKWLYAFVERKQLYIRSNNRLSFIVYDPENISDKIMEQCIVPAKIKVEITGANPDEISYLSIVSLLEEVFCYSQSGNLCSGTMEFHIEKNYISNAPAIEWFTVENVTEAHQKNLGFIVRDGEDSQMSVRCSLVVPEGANPGELYESLLHAKEMYERTFLERSLTDIEEKRAQNLYAVIKTLFGDDSSLSDDQEAIVPNTVLIALHADLVRVDDLRDQSNKFQLLYDGKKNLFEKIEMELVQADGKLRSAAYKVEAKVKEVREKFKDFPELLDLIDLFVYSK